MSQRVTTAGMCLCWATESTAGTRPTSGFVKIPEIKSVPSFNNQPDTVESTTLEETEYRTYETGLKSLDGSLGFTANLTDDLETAWNTLITAHDTAAAASPAKATWFAIVHPKLAKATFWKGTPAPIGMDEAGVAAMAETTLYISLGSAPIRETKPTLAT